MTQAATRRLTLPQHFEVELIVTFACARPSPDADKECCAAGSSKGFFDSSVGAQFATRSESPKKAAPAPRQSSFTKASSGGGFFDSSVGSQFASRSESPKKAAPALRQSSPTKASSAGGFFDSSVGSQFANKSESLKKTAPRQAAPTTSSAGKRPTLVLLHNKSMNRQTCVSTDARPIKHALTCLSATSETGCAWLCSRSCCNSLQKVCHCVVDCLTKATCAAHAAMCLACQQADAIQYALG